jgi:hypothetical protein
MLHQPTEGDYVILSPDHESFDASAKDGPLRDSTAGVVIAVDNLHPSPFLVRTSENETWRYCKHTLQVVGQPGDLLMPDMAYKGILVQRGPDWYGAKLMGGTGGGGMQVALKIEHACASPFFQQAMGKSGWRGRGHWCCTRL